MSKKVFIGVGHGGNDPGASKYLVEKDINLKMAKACKEYLEKYGVSVAMSREKDENDDISEEIRECNAFNPDLAIDVHNNAGGGDGFEVLHSVVGGVGKTLASNIETEVKKIGQNSRGLKTKVNSNGSDYFGFIRSTKCPAVICEGVFVDNEKDAKQADTDAECKAFGEAYAKGILTTLGIKANKTTSDAKKLENGANKDVVASSKAEAEETFKADAAFKVKVTASALNIRRGPGLNYKTVGMITDKGVYTIIETKNDWGRLKSGAGWIKLSYTKRV